VYQRNTRLKVKRSVWILAVPLGLSINFFVATDVLSTIKGVTVPGIKWSYRVMGPFSSPAIGGGGRIYVGSDYYNLYSINSDGTLF